MARQTAAGPHLAAAVGRRAAAGPCAFTLLVPAGVGGPHRMEPPGRALSDAESRCSAALPLLSRAARGEVIGIVAAHEPLAAVRDALSVLGFDEVIISTLPRATSRWLRAGLPAQVSGLGVPVSTVAPGDHGDPDRSVA